MGTPVARKTVDQAGGIIIQGRETVIVNNQPIATRSDAINPHAPGGTHSNSVIVGHAMTVWAEDQEVARRGDPTSCGHRIGPGSGNVYVE